MGRLRKQIVVGSVFHQLTLLENLNLQDSAGNYLGRFLCACGVEKLIRLTRVASGTTQSCGCLILSNLAAMTTTHGLSKTREFHIWQNMKYRCEKVGSKDYESYGAKGVLVDPRWVEFETFLSDMGKAPSIKHTLDRVNGSLGYSPENCRWATAEEQSNNRTCVIKYLWRGRNFSVPQIAREVNMNSQTLKHRLDRGMDIESAVTLPVKSKEARVWQP